MLLRESTLSTLGGDRPQTCRICFADGDETPQGPDRKRRKSEATEAAAGPSWEERRAEALALLQKSRLISEEGIGATWGEPATDIKAASAAIRAWRPIQVSI